MTARKSVTTHYFDFNNNIINQIHQNMVTCKGLIGIFVILFWLVWAETLGPSAHQTVNHDPTNTLHYRREFVLNMTLHEWSSITDKVFINNVNLSTTSVNSSKAELIIPGAITTLLVMKQKKGYEDARRWIEDSLNYTTVDQERTVSDVVRQFVGPLVSSFALTGSDVFSQKAIEFAEKLHSQYNISDIYTRSSKMALNWTLQRLEYRYLSSLSPYLNSSYYWSNMTRIEDFLTGSETNETQRDIHQYRSKFLTEVKSYLQSGGADEAQFERFKQSIDLITGEAGPFRTIEVDGVNLTYIRPYMTEGDCSLGALFALSAQALQESLDRNQTIGEVDGKLEMERIAQHWALAQGLTETCHRASTMTRTGLPPAKIIFDPIGISMYEVIKPSGGYQLTSHLAETYFVLYRLTRKQKYRDYAWALANAIKDHCKSKSSGFSGVTDVNQIPAIPNQNQKSPVFISATLKFLYLTFAPDIEYPLNQWVFTSSGHPLPVCGANGRFVPKQGCW